MASSSSLPREKKRREAIAQAEIEQQCRLEDSHTHPGVEDEHTQEKSTEPRVFHDLLPTGVQGLQSATSGPLLPRNRRLDLASAPGQDIDNVDPANGDEVQPQRRRPQRSAGARCLPGRYRDILPEGPAPLSATPARPVGAPGCADHANNGDAPQESQVLSASRVEEAPVAVYRTLQNAFNVFWEYLQRPLRIPDEDAPLETFSLNVGSLDAESITQKLSDAIKPFGNMSIYRIDHWFHSCGGELSRQSLASLITDVLKAKDFSPDDLPGAQTIDKLNAALDGVDKGESRREGEGGGEGDVVVVGDGWIKESVRIEIPTGVKQSNKRSNNHPPASTPFNVPGLFRRPLVEVIKSACQDDSARDFHYEPFRSFQVRPPTQSDSEEILLQLHDELYASDAWHQENWSHAM
ncbi:hypothetical protein FRC04_005954 [Tulasnella sp. 424]|nr:hypothetical protein FRC04_005954 [Tulasnella sp. 424]KAG8971129.1 hypothetical protein FRC05_011498 [Tulasnella sp. 425]